MDSKRCHINLPFVPSLGVATAEEGVETEDVLAPRLLLSTRLSRLMSWREADGGAFVFVGVAHCPPKSFLIALAWNDMGQVLTGPAAVTFHTDAR